MTLLIIAFIVFVLFVVFITNLLKGKSNKSSFSTAKPAFDPKYYKKKKFIFDNQSEYKFFSVLEEILGGKYYIFTQVNYGHLIDITWKNNRSEETKYRNRIDRKSADFVICAKPTYEPILVIDLDGSVHDLQRVKDSDAIIDEIMNGIGWPLLRIKVSESTDINLIRTKLRERELEV